MPKCFRRHKKFKVNFVSLLSRTGRDEGTQLGKQDAEQAVPVQLNQFATERVTFDYGSLKLLARVYETMADQNIVGDSPDKPVVQALADVGRVFLHNDSKNELMAGNRAPLPPSSRMENVNMKNFRDTLVRLQEDPNIKKDEEKLRAVKATLNALDEQRLLEMIELADVYTHLGRDVVVPEENLKKLMDNLCKQGILAPDEVNLILDNFIIAKKRNVTPAAIAQNVATDLVIKQDGNVATKRCMMTRGVDTNEIEYVEVVKYGEDQVIVVPRGTKVTQPGPGGPLSSA